MISEKRFASDYGFFWREILPMADRYLKGVNLSAKRYGESYAAVTSDRLQASAVGELGFRLAAEFHELPRPPLGPSDLDTLRIFADQHLGYLLKLPGFNGSSISQLLSSEILQGVNYARSIRNFLKMQRFSNVVFGPRFSGCGIIDDCSGDILADGVLIEVKTVDRPFRTTDIRQLLTYYALNYAKNSFAIEKLCLLNPLQGTYFIALPNSMCHEMAGSDNFSVLQAIVEFVCDADRWQE